MGKKKKRKKRLTGGMSDYNNARVVSAGRNWVIVVGVKLVIKVNIVKSQLFTLPFCRIFSDSREYD